MMRPQKRMAAAKWATSALSATLRGDCVALPSQAPAYAADLIEAARLSVGFHMSQDQRREVAGWLAPVFTKDIIGHALYLADAGCPGLPRPLEPEESKLDLLLPEGRGLSLTPTLATNLLKDALFNIASVGRQEPISQTRRQRDARRAEDSKGPLASPSCKEESAQAGNSISVKIEGPLARVLHLMRRLPR